MGFLKGLFKGGKEDGNAPEGLQEISWGVAQPVMVRLSSGAGRFRAYGKYSLKIVNPGVFGEECCDPEDAEAMERFRTSFAQRLVRAFSDSLVGIAGSMTAGELAAGIGKIEKSMMDELQQDLQQQGLTLERLSVDKLVQV